ncbi:hypothetical protein ACM258_18585 [Phaeobacter piscinae]|uniref:hypothetical protein n=1 Tax=Phaeobacter piscinae TaxID=1580596 RepID=UPI001FD3C378|nr:hypothetical protein [Phaeobacter piscinae]
MHPRFHKAYTSASLKIPTSVLNQAPDADGYSQLGKVEDGILLLTGGLPVQILRETAARSASNR